MNVLLVIVLIVLMGFVVLSLVRGLIAFLKTTRINLENGTAEQITEMQLAQNRAMFARIKYQAAAVLVVALILAMGGK